MRVRHLWLASLAPLLLATQAPVARDHTHLDEPAACAPCHGLEAVNRWATARHRPCTQLCLTCHSQEDMAKHHPVGTQLTKPIKTRLSLTGDRRTACATCHDLSRPRHDRVRWKADSLFGRLFRKQEKYPTYYLAIRNDRGQLCLACH